MLKTPKGTRVIQAPTAGRDSVRVGHLRKAGRESGLMAGKCQAKTRRDGCKRPVPALELPKAPSTHHHGAADDAVWSRQGNDRVLDLHLGHASLGSHIAQVSHVPAHKHGKLRKLFQGQAGSSWYNIIKAPKSTGTTFPADLVGHCHCSQSFCCP